MNFIINQYKTAFSFVKSNILKLFLISAGIFFLIMLISYFVFKQMPHVSESLMNYFAQMVDDSGIITQDGINVYRLFANNMRATLIAIMMGFVPFLFLQTSFVLISNAVMVGAATEYSLSMGIGLTTYITALLPHGIFELPAVFYSVGLSIYLCISLSKKLMGKELNFKTVTINVLRAYVLIAIPLLAIAAVIEAYLTPLLIGLTM